MRFSLHRRNNSHLLEAEVKSSKDKYQVAHEQLLRNADFSCRCGASLKRGKHLVMLKVGEGPDKLEVSHKHKPSYNTIK